MTDNKLTRSTKVSFVDEKYSLLTATSESGEDFVFLKLKHATDYVAFSPEDVVSIIKVFRSVISKTNQSILKEPEIEKDQTSSQKMTKKSIA